MFELDGINLKFTHNALKEIAKKAMDQKTGARGLRNVMESIMLDTMYKLPSLSGVRECLINKSVIVNSLEPILIYEQQARSA